MIYLEEIVPPETPPLNDVRDAVLTDLNYIRQGELKESIFQQLLNEYQLVFDLQAEELDGFEEVVRNKLDR